MTPKNLQTMFLCLGYVSEIQRLSTVWHSYVPNNEYGTLETVNQHVV